MPEKTAEKFSLKDALFNAEKVEKIANEIQEVYSEFNAEDFREEVLKAFPQQELKERIYHICNILQMYLPSEYREAVKILLDALPLELDPARVDDDFGDFIYAPYAEYVVAFGCNDVDLDFSLRALREITKRFSVEFAIRDFINQYPDETLAMLESCAKSENYHERRLASEGLRPKLPWAKKVTIDHRLPFRHLELLYGDKTRYVTRSVANHLNDISKIDAPLVLKTLARWKSEGKQESKEMAFILNHALRTLVKEGNRDALALLGYAADPAIKAGEVYVQSSTVKVGEALVFTVELEALEEVNLLVDYVIHFCTKKGTLSPKVHKLKKFSMQKGEKRLLAKRHLFKANMSTRTLHAGEHLLEVQINGTIVSQKIFELKV